MRILLLFLITLNLACNKASEEVSLGLRYFPSKDLLENGLVWKYYSHGTEKNGQTQTNISYKKMKLSDLTLFVEHYDAGFQKEYSNELLIEDHLWKLSKQKSYRFMNFDPTINEATKVQIDKDIEIDWLGNKGWIDKTNVTKKRGFRLIDKQYENIDSISGTIKIKVIKAKREFIRIFEQERDTFNYNIASIYEAGLGLTKSTRVSDKYTRIMELDELMTEKEFEKRKNHGTHRVGYIDTLRTIDDHRLFAPCFSPTKINDYYNDRKAEFKGGKGRLKTVLSEKLISTKLAGASGYLTFRFVVNCNGEAGWFVTEEADLEYNKTEFREETKMHLYDILKAEKEWTYLSVRNNPRDAYTYITFKLSDGTITEILP